METRDLLHPNKDEERIARRRQQSMLCQRQYREKQKASHEQLEMDVASLQNETLELEARRSKLHEMNGVLDFINLSRQYFEIFRHGFTSQRDLSEHEHYFLNNLVATNLKHMGESGVDALLSTWKQYTTLFGKIQIDCDHLEVVGIFANTVQIKASLKSHIRLSNYSIQILFPHMLDRPKVVERLKRAPMRLQSVTLISFDKSNTKITKLDVTANIVTALAEQLQDLSDVNDALTFENALCQLQELKIF